MHLWDPKWVKSRMRRDTQDFFLLLWGQEGAFPKAQAVRNVFGRVSSTRGQVSLRRIFECPCATPLTWSINEKVIEKPTEKAAAQTTDGSYKPGKRKFLFVF